MHLINRTLQPIDCPRAAREKRALGSAASRAAVHFENWDESCLAHYNSIGARAAAGRARRMQKVRRARALGRRRCSSTHAEPRARAAKQRQRREPLSGRASSAAAHLNQTLEKRWKVQSRAEPNAAKRQKSRSASARRARTSAAANEACNKSLSTKINKSLNSLRDSLLIGLRFRVRFARRRASPLFAAPARSDGPATVESRPAALAAASVAESGPKSSCRRARERRWHS